MSEQTTVVTGGEHPDPVPLVVAGLEMWETAKVKTDQNGIKTALGKIDDRIHNNMIQCYLHGSVHGDTSLQRRLLLDIIGDKTGYRQKGCIVHMRIFTPMELKGDNINLSGVVTPAYREMMLKKFPLEENGKPNPLGIDPAVLTVGARRPWLIEQANATPFRGMVEAAEEVSYKPVYQDDLVDRVARIVSTYKKAVANTSINPGKEPTPLDPSKPFFDGIHLDELEKAFDSIELIVAKVSSLKDPTKSAREAAVAKTKADLELEWAKNAGN